MVKISLNFRLYHACSDCITEGNNNISHHLDMNREGTLPYNCVIYNHIFSILFRLQTVYGLQVKSHFENVVCMISQ